MSPETRELLGEAPPEFRPAEEGSQTVLVADATGRQGGAVVRHLLRAGWNPRALTRDAGSPGAEALREMGVEVVQGDMSDEATLLPAMEGVHGVFSVQDYWAAGALEEVRQGMNMANAALKSGVNHFVYSSVASADAWSQIDHFETKYMVEKHLRWIGLKRTILRPVLFMESYLETVLGKGTERGWFMNPLPRNRKVQLVSVDDLGAFAAAAFLNPGDFMGKVIEIAGDELSNTEIAGVLSASSGRHLRFRRLPMILARPFHGKGMHRMYRWLADTGFGVDIEGLRRQYPKIPLISLGEWMARRGQGSKRMEDSGVEILSTTPSEDATDKTLSLAKPRPAPLGP